MPGIVLNDESRKKRTGIGVYFIAFRTPYLGFYNIFWLIKMFLTNVF